MTCVCFDRRPLARLSLVAIVVCVLAGFAAELPKSVPAGSFDQVAKPFLTKHCVSCHDAKKHSGDLVLHTAQASSIQDDRPTWESVLERLKLNEMPPKKQPQ